MTLGVLLALKGLGASWITTGVTESIRNGWRKAYRRGVLLIYASQYMASLKVAVHLLSLLSDELCCAAETRGSQRPKSSD